MVQPPQVPIPPAFAELAAGRPQWTEWFAGLPALLHELLGEWQLEPDGATMAGNCAVVVPVRTPDGQSAVLKVGWPHWEAQYEHLALRIWDGVGAVRLLRADPRRFALLLERVHAGRDLTAVPVLEACEVIAGLYGQLHRPALPQTRLLSELCRDWHGRLPPLLEAGLLPRRLVTRAAALLLAFADDPDVDATLIHTDLHYFNVLAAERQPWLAIDPKPIAGDPAYEIAPLLWNRWDEALATGNLREAILARMFAVLDATGLDEDRVRDWIVVREVVNVLWAYEDALGGAALHPEEVTSATTIAKAVQR